MKLQRRICVNIVFTLFLLKPNIALVGYHTSQSPPNSINDANALSLKYPIAFKVCLQQRIEEKVIFR